MQAKAPSWLLLPHLYKYRGSKRGASAKHVDEYVATVWDWLRATLQEAQIQSTAEAQQHKCYYDWKIGAMDLKPGDLVLVKADTFQRKRKIKDWWEDKSHEVVHLIATDIPSYEVMDQHRQSHILHCTDSSSSHQRLAFPYVWVSTKYGTDIPAPPQLSLLPGGVTVRLHHEKMVVWCPPSIRPERLSWDGSTGSYNLSHGHLLQHPLKMGEDSR